MCIGDETHQDGGANEVGVTIVSYKHSKYNYLKIYSNNYLVNLTVTVIQQLTK